MIWGENLSAEDVMVTCRCGIVAAVEVIDKSGYRHGWYCRECAARVRQELRKHEQAKIAKAIVRVREDRTGTVRKDKP